MLLLALFLSNAILAVERGQATVFGNAPYACASSRAAIKPMPLHVVPPVTEYIRLAYEAERVLDAAGYVRYNYTDPALSVLKCAVSVRVNTLHDEFMRMVALLHHDSNERTPALPRNVEKGCAASATYGTAWTAFARTRPGEALPPLTPEVHAAANAVDLSAVLGCRSGFAAAQAIVCAAQEVTAGSLAALPLSAVANCLVRLAAAAAAVHPIVAFTFDDGAPLEHMQPASIARAMSEHLAEYTLRTASASAAREAAIPRLFQFDSLPRGNIAVRDVAALEPIEPDLRNLLFRETGYPIVLRGYRLLPSLPSFVRTNYRRTVLIDVGTNGFLASPKALLDAYAPYMLFDDVVLIEPHASAVPPEYAARYPNLRIVTAYSEVGGERNASRDVAQMLKQWVTRDDFVVLKYDVDEGVNTPTLEWGFFFDLAQSGALDLVDELFIELHFWSVKPFGSFDWLYHGHSMHEAYDLMRSLRSFGHAVHAWP